MARPKGKRKRKGIKQRHPRVSQWGKKLSPALRVADLRRSDAKQWAKDSLMHIIKVAKEELKRYE